ncbi:MAG: amidohydrolase [Oscillospiraceae bacterium]|nr:amidohydrolase [Oscillospiraceae bacterium]MBQ3242188.1 amidohydrolase [Oscillospiraceae bacterium]MBQ7082066.1 amidohydrolase [Oscillospiraceae bacterium]MBR2635670.1 amidohydrolase [Oscillospiraceae bacterium]
MTGKPSGGNGGSRGGASIEERFAVTFTRMDNGGPDKMVLLPLDLTTRYGGWIANNEEVKQIVDYAPDRFIGFASVDPYRPDALEVLEHAFKDLKLAGLKLHPSKQAFYPDDPMMDPIYEMCIKYNKPIMFHAGMSWEPDCLIKYSRPINFEPVAVKYPQLRMCLAHFGWPWATETAMLCLKYPNIYTDTSIVPMDSPEIFYRHIFTDVWGPTWFEQNFADKVMYGSNSPRNHTKGIERLEMRPETRKKLMGGNALKWLGMEEK